MLAALPVAAAPAEDLLNGNQTALVDTSRVVDLDEVTVVAQPKESQRLRLQPLASTVLTTAELQQQGVDNLSRLSAFVPSFSAPAYGSRLSSSFYMRGVGSRLGSPSVGIYYDHIPLVGKTALNNHFYQLDRVDVLRGPQATLYGVNNESGLVRIFSKNPMQYQGTDIVLGLGTGLHRNVELAHFHRPSERLAFSVAGFYTGQKGFFTNQHTGEANDRADEAGAKLHLIWKAAERLTVDLTSDYQYTNQTGFPYGYYDTDSGETDEPSTTATNGYRRQMVNTGLNLSFDLGSVLLTSTTSHQYLWDRMDMDQDYVPADFMHLQQTQKMNALTQEFVARSKSDSRWQHTSGLFGSYQWLHTTAPVYFGDAMGTFILEQWMGAAAARMHSFMTFHNNWVPGDFHTPQLNLGVYHESRIRLTDRLTATLGLRYDYEQLKIDYLTQARFDLEVNMAAMSGRPGAAAAAAPPVRNPYLSEFNASHKKSYGQLLPKVGFTWQVADDGSNLYALVSKGFRAGGYNLQMFSDIFQTEERGLGHELRSMMTSAYTASHTQQDIDNVNETISYEPETSWNYEVGTHLNLFGNKVQADVSAFYTQVRNQQLTVMAGNYGYGRMMVNAGKSNICGVEVALRGKAANNHLSWAATYSFTRAKFAEYDDSVEVADAAGSKHNEYISYKDKNVPFVPKHQFSAMADWRVDLNGPDVFRSITFGLNAAGQGRTYWEADNELSQKFYAVVGAHIALDMGAVVLDVWGRNITNTRYNTFLVNSKLTNQNFAQLGNPAQMGVDLRIHL